MYVDFKDSIHGNEWAVELSENDFIFLNDTWYREDELLVELSNTTKLFQGRTCWADLELVHFQLLLLRAFDLLRPNHTKDPVVVRFHEPFTTFRFLASAIVKWNYLNGVTGFETLIISRVRESRVLIDFCLTYKFDWNEYVPPVEKPKPIFQVVVDNTKAKNV